MSHEVESLPWNISQIMKIKNAGGIGRTPHHPVEPGTFIKVEHVTNYAAIPFALNDESGFYSDALTFNDWASRNPDDPCDETSALFKKIWMVVMIAVHQKNIGTPGFSKTDFLTTTNYYKDFRPWAFQKISGKPRPVAYDASWLSEGGLRVFDRDVGAHYSFIEETKKFPPMPTKKKSKKKKKKSANNDGKTKGKSSHNSKNNNNNNNNNIADDDESEDENEDDEDGVGSEYREGYPIPPMPIDRDRAVASPKYRIVLQPLRKAKAREEVGGFIVWIFAIDPHWSVDEARCDFINAVQKYKHLINRGEAAIANKAQFPPRMHSLNENLVECIKEVCLEDPDMPNLTHRDWARYCAQYDFCAEVYRKKLADAQLERDRQELENANANATEERGEGEEEDFDFERDLSGNDLHVVPVPDDSDSDQDTDHEVRDIDASDSTSIGRRDVAHVRRQEDQDVEEEDAEREVDEEERNDEERGRRNDGRGRRRRAIEMEVIEDTEYHASEMESYADYFWKKGVDGPGSFHNVFTDEKAWIIAEGMGMEVNDEVKNCVMFKYDNDVEGYPTGTKTFKLQPRKPDALLDRFSRPSSSSRANGERTSAAYDKLYLAGLDSFYWWCSSSKTGLKNSYFPWVGDDESPLYRRANIRLPKSMAGSHRKRKRQDSGGSIMQTLRILDGTDSQNDNDNDNANENDNENEVDVNTTSEARKRFRRISEESDGVRRLETPLLHLQASRRGIAYTSAKLCGVHYYPESDRAAGSALSVPRKISDDAKKDAFTNMAEVFAGWNKSLRDYLNVARHQVELGKLVPGDANDEYFICRPNRFMRDFYAAKATYQSASAKHLFRIFKAGSDSTLNVSAIRLGEFYMQNLYGKRPSQHPSMKMMYLNQDDPECSLFASYVKKQAYELRYTHEIICNWKEFVLIYFGCLDVYRHENNLHFSYLASGEKGVGKSFLALLVMYLFVLDTVRYHFDASAKSGNCEISQSDHIRLYDELPPFLMGNGGMDRHGYSTDPQVGAKKASMTTGKEVYSVFQFATLPDGTTGRLTIRVDTPSVSCFLVVCNVPLKEKALLDRFHVTAIAEHDPVDADRDIEDDHDPNLDGTHDTVDQLIDDLGAMNIGNGIASRRIDPDALRRQRRAAAVRAARKKRRRMARGGGGGGGGADGDDINGPPTILDMQSSIKPTDRKSLMEISKFGYSTMQTLHFCAEKAIGVGLLDPPNMTVASLLLTKVLNYVQVNSKCLVTMGLRSYARVINEARTMTITDAFNSLYFATCRDRDIINEKTLLGLAPYLFCQIHVAVFAITLLVSQILDPHYNSILKSAMESLCYFPVTSFLSMKKQLEEIENEKARAFCRPARTDRTRGIRRRRAANAQTNVHDNNDDDDENNIDEEYEDMGEMEGEEGEEGEEDYLDDDAFANASAPPYLNTTIAGDEISNEAQLLIDIFKRSYSPATGTSNIKWKTIVERTPSIGGVEKTLTKVDLNYVMFEGVRPDAIEIAIHGKMSTKIARSDIAKFLRNMEDMRIKVPYAAKPAEAEHIVQDVPNIHFHDGDHEFPILEQVQERKNSGITYKWHVCIHAINHHGGGDDLIMQAIRESLAYEGLRPRPKVLTGFVQGDITSGRFAYRELMPDDKKRSFEIKSTSHQEKHISALLRFNESLPPNEGSSGFRIGAQSSPSTKRSRSLNDILRDLDEAYKNKSIAVKDDLDDWAAVTHFKTTGLPMLYVVDRKGVKSPRWIYTDANGETELRPLPTENNQRIRNLHYIKHDVMGTRDTHEEFWANECGEDGREIPNPYADCEGFEPLYVKEDYLTKEKPSTSTHRSGGDATGVSASSPRGLSRSPSRPRASNDGERRGHRRSGSRSQKRASRSRSARRSIDEAS